MKDVLKMLALNNDFHGTIEIGLFICEFNFRKLGQLNSNIAFTVDFLK